MIQQSTIDLIKRFEGCRLQSYRDRVGIWTIGYGTIRYENGMKVQEGDKITQSEADKLLLTDILIRWKVIEPMLKIKLNQNQIDAIVSIAYNIGIGAFVTSTLLKRINAGKGGIRAAFMMWNKGKVKVKNPITGELETVTITIDGLTIRRKEEADLYFS